MGQPALLHWGLVLTWNKFWGSLGCPGCTCIGVAAYGQSLGAFNLNPPLISGGSRNLFRGRLILNPWGAFTKDVEAGLNVEGGKCREQTEQKFFFGFLPLLTSGETNFNIARVSLIVLHTLLVTIK